jgi:hypothetical protein
MSVRAVCLLRDVEAGSGSLDQRPSRNGAVAGYRGVVNDAASEWLERREASDCESRKSAMTNFERLDEFPRALLASVLELLAERKVNHPGAALTLSPDDLASSWDLVAESAALPDPPAQPDAGEEVASTYWYEQALSDLLDTGFLLEREDHSFRVSDLEALLRFRDGR